MARPFIDIVGKRIGTWTVVHYTNKRKVECVCDCGNKRITDSATIRQQDSLVCYDCIKTSYIGLVFNDWTSLGKSDRSTNGKIKLKCKCKCGNIGHLYLGMLRSGRSRGCVSCGWQKQRKPNNESAVNNLFSQYKRQAKNRHIEWGISKEQFITLIKSNCYYTGLPPSNLTKKTGIDFLYNGIDRIDDRIGYFIDNCVPCIGDINMMKRSLDCSRFMNLCNLVANHFRENQNNPKNQLKAV